MNLLRSVRQVGGKQHIAVGHDLQRRVQNDGQTVTLVLILRQFPRLLSSNVGIGLADHMHGLVNPGAETRMLNVIRNDVESFLREIEESVIGVSELKSGNIGDFAEVLRRHGHRAVDQVAPRVG